MKNVLTSLMATVFGWATTVSADNLNSLKPGQYNLSDMQQICLVNDGTWYGTTFNFSGRWVDVGKFGTNRAFIYGNYGVGSQPFGYASDTMTVYRLNGADVVVWYDWFNDFSYNFVGGAASFSRVKSKCDPPFNGQNTHAATQ
jgi:hypothetical protein